jgi:hypothetical protein
MPAEVRSSRPMWAGSRVIVSRTMCPTKARLSRTSASTAADAVVDADGARPDGAWLEALDVEVIVIVQLISGRCGAR